MESPHDRTLMARLAGGDREALAPLVDRHYPRLYRVALAYLRNPDDALEAVQESFVKACERAATWREASEVGPWLTRIVVNESIDRYRRGKRTLARFEPLAEGDRDARAASDSSSPEDRVAGREIGERIGAALARLPERQRAIFVLRHYRELSLEEVAATLELPLGTVKSSLHRALQRLRGELSGLL